jgi:hypothetical protein
MCSRKSYFILKPQRSPLISAIRGTFDYSVCSKIDLFLDLLVPVLSDCGLVLATLIFFNRTQQSWHFRVAISRELG